jgi:hypothetical protein
MREPRAATASKRPGDAGKSPARVYLPTFLLDHRRIPPRFLRRRCWVPAVRGGPAHLTWSPA